MHRRTRNRHRFAALFKDRRRECARLPQVVEVLFFFIELEATGGDGGATLRVDARQFHWFTMVVLFELLQQILVSSLVLGPLVEEGGLVDLWLGLESLTVLSLGMKAGLDALSDGQLLGHRLHETPRDLEGCCLDWQSL